jgi:hypothetical protein
MGKLGCGCPKDDLLCDEPIIIANSVLNIIRNPEACVPMAWLATEIELVWFHL